MPPGGLPSVGGAGRFGVRETTGYFLAVRAGTRGTPLSDGRVAGAFPSGTRRRGSVFRIRARGEGGVRGYSSRRRRTAPRVWQRRSSGMEERTVYPRNTTGRVTLIAEALLSVHGHALNVGS